jgi:AraC-like DNA-binding protein
MLYLEYRPDAPLSDYVDVLWYVEGYQPRHRLERVLPNGSMQIVISLVNNRLTHRESEFELPARIAPSVIAGVRSDYMVIDTVDLVGMVGVHFRPAGAAPLLGTPASEFTGAHVALEDLWGSGAAELRERLCESPTPDSRLRLLAAALNRRLSGARNNHAAVLHALGHFSAVPHMLTIREIVRQTGLSHRGFSELFRRHVGLTPKLYCRIRRFQHALRQMTAGQQPRWADIAAACGFSDQSHLVHEFQAFSGVSPNVCLDKRAGWVNHLAVE